MVFIWRMVPEVIQPFWEALQRGEFTTSAAEGVGTYQKKGARWMAAEGGVRPRRGRDLHAGCVELPDEPEMWVSTETIYQSLMCAPEARCGAS